MDTEEKETPKNKTCLQYKSERFSRLRVKVELTDRCDSDLWDLTITLREM